MCAKFHDHMHYQLQLIGKTLIATVNCLRLFVVYKVVKLFCKCCVIHVSSALCS